MRALEFKSKIKDNRISIPRRLRHEFFAGSERPVRVVVYVEDSDVYDEKAFRKMTANQFLNGYAETDSVYDL